MTTPPCGLPPHTCRSTFSPALANPPCSHTSSPYLALYVLEVEVTGGSPEFRAQSAILRASLPHSRSKAVTTPPTRLDAAWHALLSFDLPDHTLNRSDPFQVDLSLYAPHKLLKDEILGLASLLLYPDDVSSGLYALHTLPLTLLDPSSSTSEPGRDSLGLLHLLVRVGGHASQIGLAGSPSLARAIDALDACVGSIIRGRSWPVLAEHGWVAEDPLAAYAQLVDPVEGNAPWIEDDPAQVAWYSRMMARMPHSLFSSPSSSAVAAFAVTKVPGSGFQHWIALFAPPSTTSSTSSTSSTTSTSSGGLYYGVLHAQRRMSFPTVMAALQPPLLPASQTCTPAAVDGCWVLVPQSGHMPESKLIKALGDIEDPDPERNVKIGILYAAAGQTDERDMFGNLAEQASDEYTGFLNTMGTRVTLKGYTGYAAQLDTEFDGSGLASYATSYAGYEIMFHVSTELHYDANDDQHIQRKRFIGNDIVVIVFVDDPVRAPYASNTMASKYTRTLIVVAPVPTPEGGVDEPHYSVGVVRSADIQAFGPLSPPGPIPQSLLRAHILSKAINGQRATIRSPEFVVRSLRTRRLLLHDFFKTLFDIHPDAGIPPDGSRGKGSGKGKRSRRRGKGKGKGKNNASSSTSISSLWGGVRVSLSDLPHLMSQAWDGSEEYHGDGLASSSSASSASASSSTATPFLQSVATMEASQVFSLNPMLDSFPYPIRASDVYEDRVFLATPQALFMNTRGRGECTLALNMPGLSSIGVFAGADALIASKTVSSGDTAVFAFSLSALMAGERPGVSFVPVSEPQIFDIGEVDGEGVLVVASRYALHILKPVAGAKGRDAGEEAEAAAAAASAAVGGEEEEGPSFCDAHDPVQLPGPITSMSICSMGVLLGVLLPGGASSLVLYDFAARRLFSLRVVPEGHPVLAAFELPGAWLVCYDGYGEILPWELDGTLRSGRTVVESGRIYVPWRSSPLHFAVRFPFVLVVFPTFTQVLSALNGTVIETHLLDVQAPFDCSPETDELFVPSFQHGSWVLYHLTSVLNAPPAVIPPVVPAAAGSKKTKPLPTLPRSTQDSDLVRVGDRSPSLTVRASLASAAIIAKLARRPLPPLPASKGKKKVEEGGGGAPSSAAVVGGSTGTGTGTTTTRSISDMRRRKRTEAWGEGRKESATSVICGVDSKETTERSIDFDRLRSRWEMATRNTESNVYDSPRQDSLRNAPLPLLPTRVLRFRQSGGGDGGGGTDGMGEEDEEEESTSGLSS